MHNNLGLSWELAFTDSAITNILLMVSGYIIYTTLKYYQPANENFFYLRLWVVLLAAINSAILYYILPYNLYADSNYITYINKGLYLRFSYQFLMLATITMINWMGFYFKNKQELEKRKIDAENQSKEAELLNLRKQLQPHFLFNSLNSIHTLVGSKPQEAREMIEQLSGFLRHTLRKNEQQLIHLREELQGLQLYLEIEKVRFGNRLEVMMNTQGSCLDMKLPALILQPLVENAIKFGLYETLEQTVLELNTRCTEQELLIEIKNPYDAEFAKHSKGTGFGMSSVQRRLFLLYARNDLMQATAENGIYTVTIKIPQQHEVFNN
ncbi:MAG: sensor histidine kinase [Bacteroidia bacterium]